jgi:hypothetical protein
VVIDEILIASELEIEFLGAAAVVATIRAESEHE